MSNENDRTPLTIIPLVDNSQDDEIGEWVGLHYLMDFNSLSSERREEFRQRYAESHEENEDQTDVTPAP